MAPSTLYKVFYPAREAAGRQDLRWHDLRHTGAVLAAQTGATLAELMGRLGHTTPGAAMRYQHAAADRDTEIARRLSALVSERGWLKVDAMTEGTTWTTEFYEDDAGRRPVELWMDSLTVAEFAALRAAIVRVLEVRGMGLGFGLHG